MSSNEKMPGAEEVEKQMKIAKEAIKAEDTKAHGKFTTPEEEKKFNKHIPDFKYQTILMKDPENIVLKELELTLIELENKIEEVKKDSTEQWNQKDTPKNEVEVQTKISDEEALGKVSPLHEEYFKKLLNDKKEVQEKIKEIHQKVIGLN